MKKKVIIVVIVLLVLILAGCGIFLHKVETTKNEDGSISITWWPGIDFSFTVYEDYVKADNWTNEDAQELVIPDMVFGKPVKEIKGGFAFKRDIEKVVIGKNVETIGSYAFSECYNLKYVEGGGDVIYIGENAFSYDLALETVEVGKKVAVVGEYAFDNCTALRMLSFGEHLERIENGAFWNCDLLTCIHTSDNLRYIGIVAFRQSGLEEIYIPATLSEIERWAFFSTPWFEKQQGDENGFVIVGDGILLRYTGNERLVKIPEGIKIIGNFFTGNVGVEEIHIPDTVVEIKEAAFSDVMQSLKVYIPETVTRLGNTVDGYAKEISGNINYMGENRNLITIVTTEGSAAHQHALEYDMMYEIVEEMPEY